MLFFVSGYSHTPPKLGAPAGIGGMSNTSFFFIIVFVFVVAYLQIGEATGSRHTVCDRFENLRDLIYSYILIPERTVRIVYSMHCPHRAPFLDKRVARAVRNL